MLIHLGGVSGWDFLLHHIQYNLIHALVVVILAMVVVMAAAGEEESSTSRASNSSPFHLLVAEEAEVGPITTLKNIHIFKPASYV